ncbi:MAG: site-specific DNA-methyltransferase [Bacteroidia bacterium]|nr:site-specific DNA-methyltransferase [Bacteroidia bacterium]
MSDFINKLILGDNLEVLRSIESESVDLVYLDPPFFSNRNYEVIWGDEGEIRSFQDRWSGGIDHYIGWLKERVAEMHRVLRPTGSIFLHCDWHANAYIRVEILDKIFGYDRLLSEIIWKRTFNSGSSKSISKKFPINTDSIFWYSKSAHYCFNKITRPLNEGALKRYDKIDEKGKYMWVPLKTVSNERLLILRESGEIREEYGLQYPRYKKYLDVEVGVLIDNVWDDIGQIATRPGNFERIGYPTQKPMSLLDRIIKCASDEVDIILDPFVGGGTTISVADKLNRQWIGIDQSVQAIKVSEMRLQNQQDLFSKPFIVQLHKYDYDKLRYENAFKFETWIVVQFGGSANLKQKGDFGIDGKTQDGTPIQVKRSDNVGRNVIDNFFSSVQRFDKPKYDQNRESGRPVGFVIAFSFGHGAIEEVARLHNRENVIIKLVRVDEIVPVSNKPVLTLQFADCGLDAKNNRIIEFTATARSENSIEFYAWDFNYNAEKGFKPQVLIDKHGKQTEQFKAGTYQVAVKVVDNEGLDSLEIIKLKVNGGVIKE